MGIKQSKINQKSEPSAEYVISSPDRERQFEQYVPLQRAALKGDWKTAEKLLEEDPGLVSTQITEGGLTALHLAAAEGRASFVENLLGWMNEADLEIKNYKETTAFCYAAATGHVDIAKAMVRMNQNLPEIRGENGVTPLYIAVWEGHKKMAEYLLNVSDFQSWNENDQIEVLTRSIHSGLYDLAVKIVTKCKTLAAAEDNDETPLEVLASKPSAFCGTSKQGFWSNITSTILSFMKLKACNTCDARTLLDHLWRSLICQEDVETRQLPGRISNLLFIAAESGNDDFLVELIRRYPDCIHKVNSSKHSIFHIAVSQRSVKVFNLIYELRGFKDLMLGCIDNDKNNILHLAAKLAPPYQLNSIPGAALQMQREVSWYKEVEKLVHPSYRNKKNKEGQTPYQLFLAEHENLMKEGEKQMKQIAKSCMLVTMLIATVVFTTAFTVPGGYDNTGAPILKNKKLFMVLPISEAVATLASLISMLMFLSVLTSRYSDNDFLTTLPFWLVIGVATLFVSIAAMMVAFCCCLLFYEPERATISVLLVFFAIVPIVFVLLNYHLLITIICTTCSSRGLFRCNNRLA